MPKKIKGPLDLSIYEIALLRHGLSHVEFVALQNDPHGKLAFEHLMEMKLLEHHDDHYCRTSAGEGTLRALVRMGLMQDW